MSRPRQLVDVLVTFTAHRLAAGVDPVQAARDAFIAVDALERLLTAEDEESAPPSSPVEEKTQ